MPAGGELGFRTRAGALANGRPAVVIEVRDSGHGMPPEVARRVFEPFFTTKETGKGSGLGLAAVFGIVSAHGGVIDLETEPGVGTTFLLTLPLD